jgi:hypothetical protein
MTGLRGGRHHHREREDETSHACVNPRMGDRRFGYNVSQLVRILLASIMAFACACNSGPKNTCTVPSNAIVAGGASGSTCTGLCVDAGSSGVFCIVDCTDGGNGICGPDTVCASGEPLSPKSFCLPTCSAVEGGVAACPSPLTCGDAGVCVP